MFFLDWFFTRGVNGFFSRELFLAAPAKNIGFPPARHLFTIAYGKTPFSVTRKRCLAEVSDTFRTALVGVPVLL